MSSRAARQGGVATAFLALGIAFGDIGTSPLYALHEVQSVVGLPQGALKAMGVASLVFWTVTIIVSIKYVLFITLANHDGEGGALALASLIAARCKKNVRVNCILSFFVISSTALLFADSLITPPLSIMAAVEGLSVINESTSELITPVSIVLIVGLYTLQRFGTKTIAGLFSPVMLTWFSTIGLLGLFQIAQKPEIFLAVSPHHAIHLLSALTWPQILAVFGGVLLAATGAEAIYADLGHLGRRPIAQAWYGVAMAGLLLNYFGQSAWMLDHASEEQSAVNSFFAIVPEPFLIPVVLLATITSIIAGQAVITGMFSIAAQAARQGYLPRLRILHTSEAERGQIYVPTINVLLLAGGIMLVLGFGSSSALASSYGFAVAAAMLLTTLAFIGVTVYVWRWNTLATLVFVLIALPFDVLFFASGAFKLLDGYLITPLVALIVCFLMMVWRWGNWRLNEKAQRLDLAPEDFAEVLDSRRDLTYLSRPAIFFSHLPHPLDTPVTPYALLQQVRLTSVLYQPTIIVEFLTAANPRVIEEERATLQNLGHGVYVVRASFGYREQLSVLPVLRLGLKMGWWAKEEDIVYFSTQETIRPMARWHPSVLAVWLFVFLQRFEQITVRQLQLKSNQCMELGVAIEI